MNKLNINKIINKIKIFLPLGLMIGGNMVSADLWSFFESCCSSPVILEKKQTEIIEEIIPKEPKNYESDESDGSDGEVDSKVPKIQFFRSEIPLKASPNVRKEEDIYCTTWKLLEQGIEELTREPDTVEFKMLKLDKENGETTLNGETTFLLIGEKLILKKTNSTYKLYTKIIVPTENIIPYNAPKSSEPNGSKPPSDCSSYPKFAGSGGKCRYQVRGTMNENNFELTVYNNCWSNVRSKSPSKSPSKT